MSVLNILMAIILYVDHCLFCHTCCSLHISLFAPRSQSFFDFNVSAANSGPVVCEVCGAYFETRRGLSSHARLHLRQLGVTVSENSGAPIELLYQLIQEKDKDLKPDVAPSVSPPLPKKTSQQEPKTPVPPEDAHASSKTAAKVMTTQGSPAKLKEAGASFFPSSPSSSRPTEGSSSSLSDQKTITKPLWAPLETDAPLTLGELKLKQSETQSCGGIVCFF